jgi:ABC-2 type transport system permease protein
MRHALENIFWLATKEVRSMLHDFALLGLVIYSFSLAIYAQSQGTTGELHRAAIAIVDQDHSQLSREIAKAFLPPYFQPSMSVSPQQVDRMLDTAAYTFILDIPPHFARDVVAGRTPAVQVNVDATAAMQAGIGAGYIQQILASQIARYAARSGEVSAEPAKLVTHMAYNPNLTSCCPGTSRAPASGSIRGSLHNTDLPRTDAYDDF